MFLFVFQIKKRNSQIEFRNQEQQVIINSSSEYAKLLKQRSIYRDSIYRIYITNINDSKELVFLKKDSLTNRERESKFFVHLYPKDAKDLLGSTNHNPINFESNFISFNFNEQVYHVAHTKLPTYEIEKLNLGQYSFRGDNSINYKIKKLILGTNVAKILKENKESINNFKYQEETF